MKASLLLLSFWAVSQSLLFGQQEADISAYQLTWESHSQNSSASMPLGGGDIGLNVGVEDGELLFYFSRSGTFDEHNTLLKLGRMRIGLTPNLLLDEDEFQQILHLEEGKILIRGSHGLEMVLWVDVEKPVIHLESKADIPIEVSASFESWRHKDRKVEGAANNANSYKWAPPQEVITYADSIQFEDSGVLFYHQNREETVFDPTVALQQLIAVKDELYNPIGSLIFGGWIEGEGFLPNGESSGVYEDTDFNGWRLKSEQAKENHHISIHLHTDQNIAASQWKQKLRNEAASYERHTGKEQSLAWWKEFWDRSYIITDPYRRYVSDSVWRLGRNYQLFRFMLGANAKGDFPTKFNGGLFTVDPVHTDSSMTFTPDHRNWGGGTMTAMNQRLVHFPMIKAGDFDLLAPQLQHYLRLQKTAELRSKVYWGHDGAVFSEQLENFGLPNPTEYGWKRPENFDPGVEYNAWLEYQWDTVLEFCLMMLDVYHYKEQDISQYIPFIKSCLVFFDQHYQYRAASRGIRELDGKGHLVLYPGTANETYKMAYNANSTISGLKVITERMLQLPDQFVDTELREYLEGFLGRIPPLNYREIKGATALAPAKLWERVNNTETPQLYPVYPWGIYGIGKPDLVTAIHTYQEDPDVITFRSHVGWKQDNIFAARLGLTRDARNLTLRKMADADRRFPAFWGPGFDWVPDHNWGGSGMIGMQEMLLQDVGDTLYLFPAWPKEWDVRFKLHAPQNTIIQGEVLGGELLHLEVTPSSREKDVVNLLGKGLREKLQLDATN